MRPTRLGGGTRVGEAGNPNIEGHKELGPIPRIWAFLFLRHRFPVACQALGGPLSPELPTSAPNTVLGVWSGMPRPEVSLSKTWFLKI